MPTIEVLSPHVANLIAAGEVVERPASVAKELVENAIDAGATSVTVEIQNGGMALIRVTDNGCGIPADQCATAFLRHATSKLREAEDLSAIGTLGFRGEALAAISSVSRMELFTRTADEPLGTALTLEGGRVLSQEEAGCPLGTTMVVRDLFFNTPARLKFMKRDSAEGAAVFALLQKLALAHPDVSLKFIRDGRQELMTPGDGKPQSALYAVLGRDIALGFTEVRGEGEDVSVHGFVSQPVCCRGSRSLQHFFVNGRPVKSRLLMTALEKAYENQKMVGKYPGCVLQLDVKANQVDVNVHPAKTEVKFLYERKVFDGVYYAVLSALTGQERRPALELTPKATPRPAARETVSPAAPHKMEGSGGGFGRMTAGEYRRSVPLRDSGPSFAENLLRPLEKYTRPYTTPPQPEGEMSTDAHGFSTDSPENVEKPVENVENIREPSPASRRTPAHTPPEADRAPAEDPPAPVPPTETEEGDPSLLPPAALPWRLAGEVLDTYVIVERGDEIFFIDKHAAHERLNFDRMRAEGYTPMVQSLLAPLVFTPSPEEAEVLLEHLPLLERFGFSCADFGGGAVMVSEMPADLTPGQGEEALCEIAAALLAGGRADPEAARDAVLHTMACKAAVKGGQKTTQKELEVVAEAVLSGRVQYCPHGRPVAITLTRAQLEKQFKRT